MDRFQSLLGRIVTVALALSVLFSACASSAKDEAEDRKIGEISNSLAGQLLVAAPSMPDPRFAETVIFVVRHDRHGAMGLIVNRVIGIGSAKRLLESAGIDVEGMDIDAKVRVHYGGPVEPRRGFVLHSDDYAGEGTLEVTNRVSITAATQILHAMAKGNGPNRGFLAVGYSGWSSGQLESELSRMDWLVVPSDDQLLFDTDIATKWRRAMGRHGIEL
ncbi:MAG: YqgE/AlgH family protein [Gammaproteobacteria bacterium]